MKETKEVSAEQILGAHNSPGVLRSLISQAGVENIRVWAAGQRGFYVTVRVGPVAAGLSGSDWAQWQLKTWKQACSIYDAIANAVAEVKGQAA